MLNFTANFAGIQASTGGGFTPMGNTPFKAIIKGIEVKPKKNDNSGAMVADFELSVTEPAQFRGATRHVNTRVVDNTEPGQNSRGLWRTWLESVGYTPAMLDQQPNIQIHDGLFVGREGHFFNKAAVEGSGGRDDVEILTPSVYADRQRAQQTMGAPAQAASGQQMQGFAAPAQGGFPQQNGGMQGGGFPNAGAAFPGQPQMGGQFPQAGAQMQPFPGAQMQQAGFPQAQGGFPMQQQFAPQGQQMPQQQGGFAPQPSPLAGGVDLKSVLLGNGGQQPR